jgi:predicted DNA-binding protein
MATINVSAHIPEELAKMLDLISKIEERSKSYYIQKGLQAILEKKLEDLDDLKDIAEYKKTKDLEPTIPWEEIQKLIK